MRQVRLYLAASIAAALLAPPPAVADHIYVPAVREMTERRSATERHFLLADGTYRAEVHLQPINYKASDGTWQPIDTGLAKSAKTGFVFSNETNTLKTYLPATADGAVRVEVGAGAVSSRLLLALPSAGSVQGSSVQFADAAQRISIAYTVEPGQLKELITLNASGPAPVFRYEMTLEGLTAVENPASSVTFTDASGEAALTIPAPWMKDAAGNYGRVATSVEKTADGLLYSMQPDSKWLTRARYPVVIDPAFTTQLWTAVNRVAEPNVYWCPGVQEDQDDPGQYITGPDLLLGADYNDCWRGVLSFGIYSLPRDSELSSAQVRIHCNSAPGSANKTIQVYRITKNLSRTGSPSLYPTPTNIGVSNDDLAQYASLQDTITPYYIDEDKLFDVTGLVQDWADSRGIPLNLLLRDTQEDLQNYQRNNTVLRLDADSSTLEIVYANPGWYMLQGNNRHFGNTQYTLASSLADLQSNFARKWTTDLPTGSGEIPCNEPYYEFVPSVVAVPDYANVSSGLPVLYLPVNDRRIRPTDIDRYGNAQGAASGHTRIWRVEDTGSGYTEKAFDLAGLGVDTDIQVTGTPIVVGTALESGAPGHKLIVTGISRTATLTGPVTASEGHVMRIDVTGSGQNAQMTLKWHYKFNVDDLGQGVFASPGYWQGTTSYKNEDGDSRSYTGGVILVPVHKGNVDENDGDYLIALALDTANASGQNVWGYVTDSTGDLAYHYRSDAQTVTWGGLPYLSTSYWTEDSSPAVSITSQRAYASTITDPESYTGTGLVVARELATGERPAVPWAVGGGSVAAQAVSVQFDRFFAGRTGILDGWYDPFGTAAPTAVDEVDITGLGLGTVWCPPAFYPKDQTAVAAASQAGTYERSGLFGAAAIIGSNDIATAPKWGGDAFPGYSRGAPVVTGTVGLVPLGCLAAGVDLAGSTLGQVEFAVYSLTGTTTGQIQKSFTDLHGLVCGNMAVYGSSSTGYARVYVVAGGIQQPDPSIGNATDPDPVHLYCFAR